MHFFTSMGMLALTATQLVTRSSAISFTSGLRPCSTNTSLSCHSSSTTPTCCYQYPGGALLQTQFWDTSPSTGPSDSWTIHGLWPDNCNGGYQSTCDPARAYGNISAILQSQGRSQLLSYMKQYWVDINGDDESFWSHEWSKHGTCINTIKPSCYAQYQPQEEVGEFFQKTVDLFQGLNTYTALSNAGITPDTYKTYTLSAIESALSNNHSGQKAYVGCQSGSLNEVWYFFNVQGNIIDGLYKASAPLSQSSCPSSEIKYMPKN